MEPTKKGVKRKYDMDVDILSTLTCPICYKHFSPPVFKCDNGHLICNACLEKLKLKTPISINCPICVVPIAQIKKIQSIAIEKIVDSLQVSCKYSEHGCHEMFKPSEIDDHEENECDFEPYCCPVPECSFEGTRVTLPVHLVEKHQVNTTQLHDDGVVDFEMESSDQYVLIEGKGALQYLVHRHGHETLGNIFYCTRIGGSVWRYHLEVVPHASSVVYSMAGALAKDLRRAGDFCKGNFILLPYREVYEGEDDGPLDITFSLHSLSK